MTRSNYHSHNFCIVYFLVFSQKSHNHRKGLHSRIYMLYYVKTNKEMSCDGFHSVAV